MSFWKKSLEYTLKGAGVVALSVGAWQLSPELRDIIVEYSNGLDVCDVGRLSKSGLNFAGEAVKYVLSPAVMGASYWGSTKI